MGVRGRRVQSSPGRRSSRTLEISEAHDPRPEEGLQSIGDLLGPQDHT